MRRMAIAILQYNEAAIPPLGEAKSNWDVMRLLAEAMGYDEPWLRQSAEEAIAEVLDATRAISPLLEGITLERLQAEGTVPLTFRRSAMCPSPMGTSRRHRARWSCAATRCADDGTGSAAGVCRARRVCRPARAMIPA